jgi:hypothetical protein
MSGLSGGLLIWSMPVAKKAAFLRYVEVIGLRSFVFPSTHTST